MAVFAFPLVTKGAAHVTKTRKVSAQYQLPTAYCSNDLCGAPEWKRLGIHADFNGRVECDDLSRLLAAYHFSGLYRLNVPSAISPMGNIQFKDDAAIIAAGYVQRGPIWVKTFPNSQRIEYEVQSYSESMTDQCNNTYGETRYFSVKRYSFDSVTCDYKAVLQETTRVSVSDDLGYANFDAGVGALYAGLAIFGISTAFGGANCGGAQAAVKTAWEALNGTTISLGV